MITKKITTFGASSSIHSINKKFASYAAQQLKNVTIDLMDLNDYEMPIFSVDKEKIMLEEDGKYPELAYQFKKHLKESDGIVISFAEHNGAYSTAFKNIFDWISRIEKDVWYNKPMLLLATSPGARGGSSVLEIAVNKFQRMNSNTIIHFSLPKFDENFDSAKGIKDEDLKKEFEAKIEAFQAVLES